MYSVHGPWQINEFWKKTQKMWGKTLHTFLTLPVVHFHVNDASGLVSQMDKVAAIPLVDTSQLCRFIICPPQFAACKRNQINKCLMSGFFAYLWWFQFIKTNFNIAQRDKARKYRMRFPSQTWPTIFKKTFSAWWWGALGICVYMPQEKCQMKERPIPGVAAVLNWQLSRRAYFHFILFSGHEHFIWYTWPFFLKSLFFLKFRRVANNTLLCDVSNLQDIYFHFTGAFMGATPQTKLDVA